MGKLIDTNAEEFKKILQEEKGAIIVDFYANWCGPCKTLTPILEEVSLEVEDLIVIKIDVDQNKELLSEYGIRNIPAVLLFKEGVQSGKFVGVRKKEDVISFVETGV